MKFFLFFLLIVLNVSCKKTISPGKDGQVRNFPFDNSIYLNIPHAEDQSILRRKLLNLNLSNQLKNNDIAIDSEINYGDEFVFLDDLNKASTIDQRDYKNIRSNSAEIIVSYKDHLEIYFVPTGITSSDAIAQLKIVPDPEASFSWVNLPGKYLYKNKIYYLLSATKVDYRDNDVHFYQQKISLGDNLNDKIFTFSANQILELEIKIDYSLKETGIVEVNGENRMCPAKIAIDGGGCGSCVYKIEVASGRFLKQSVDNIDFVNFDIVVNEKKYHLNEFKPEKMENGNFKFTIELKKLVKSEFGKVQFFQNPQQTVTKSVNGFEFTYQCRYKSVSNAIDVTPSMKINLEMNTLGRTLNYL